MWMSRENTEAPVQCRRDREQSREETWQFRERMQERGRIVRTGKLEDGDDEMNFARNSHVGEWRW